MPRQEMIIDPPVGPYSTVEEINGWLDELATYESHPEVDAAIKEAEDWLETAKKTERLANEK